MNTSRIRKLLFFYLLFISFTNFSKAQTVGDLAVLSVTTNKDTLRLITLNTIASNSVFTITDNAWTGSALQTTEGYLTWTSSSTAINSGTVITFIAGGSNWSSSSTVSLGSITAADYGFGIAVAGDELLVFNGNWTITPTTFIWGYTTNGWINSGSPTSNTSYLPTGLTSYNTLFSSATKDAYFANGNSVTASVTITNTDKCAMIALLTNTAKWVSSTSGNVGSKPTYNITYGTSISYTGSTFCQSGTTNVTRIGTTGGTYSSTSGLIINSITGAINLASSTSGNYAVLYTYTISACLNTVCYNITINANTFSNGFSINTTPQCLTGNSFTFTNNSGTSAYTFGSGTGSTTQTYSNQNILSSTATTVIFRMYVYGGSTRDYQIKNFIVTGSTSAGAITSTWALTSAATVTNSGAGVSSITAASQTLGSSNITNGGYSTNGLSATVASSWPTSIDYNSYIQFSVTPTATYSLNISSIAFTERQVNGSGSITRNLMYSTDGGITFQPVPYSGASQSGLSFSWAFGDGNTSSSTSPTYNYTTANTYPVSLTVSDGSCSSTTTQSVVVNSSPTITTQPSTTNQSYCLNSTAASLSLVATGTGLTYQWYRNINNNTIGGVLISGATSSSYTPPTSSVGTYYFYCVVTSGTCSTTSNISGSYIVYPKAIPNFTINTTPQCLTGNSFNFTTTSTDTSTGTYNCNWALTSASTGVATGNGLNNLTITNFSTGATLNKAGTPSYNANGVNVGINSGNWLTDASSNNYIQFQLAPKNSTFLVVDSVYLEGAVTGGNNGTDINVVNPQISVDGGTTYYSLTTQNLNATSGIYTNLGFKLPASLVISKTSNVYFRIYIYALGTVTSSRSIYLRNFKIINNTNTYATNYAWDLGDGATATTTNVNGKIYATANSYNIKLVVSNGSSCKDSIIQPITINSSPTITTQLSATTANFCVNENISTFSFNTSGASTYQWYSNTINSNVGGTLIVGAIYSVFTPPTTAVPGTTYYYCIVSSGICTATSDVSGAIVVNVKPNISNQPSTSNQNVCQSGTVTALSVTATAGSGSISGYQWYSNTSNSNSGGTLISGATSSSYTPPSSTVGPNYYYCIVTNSNSCSTTSNASGLITINPAPTITTNPSSAATNYCLSATASTLSVVVNNATSYQWYSNSTNSNSGGTLISGATSSSYIPSTSSAGTVYYYIVAINNCGNVSSNTSGAITVFNNPSTPTLTPSSVCEGSNITFTASGGTIFEFNKNGISQGAADTTRTKTFTSLTSTDVICVKSYSPTIDGSLTNAEWGTALATSSGGPTSSGFGSKRLDALYLRNDNNYLYGAIAGNLADDASGDKILFFIDSKSGGYNTISSWGNKGTSGFYSTQNLNNCITFDAGFSPDYIMVINRGDGSVTGDVYFDLIDMQAGTKTYLGSANSSRYFNFQANSGTGDYTKGFEFALPLSSIGSPSTSLKVFAMIVNNPGTSGLATFLSNQFLGRANLGQLNYGNGCIDFTALNTPDPVSYSISSTTCFTQTCATINAKPTVAAITGTTSVCAGSTTTLSNTTSGGVWSSSNTGIATISSGGIVSGIAAGSATIKYIVTNGSGCKDSVSTTVTVNAKPTVAVITGTTSICVGGTTLLNNATASGVWSSSNAGVATISSGGLVTGISVGSSTIKYVVTNGSGCKDSASILVTVKTNTTSTTNVSICPSALPYSWNGSRTIAGTYTFTTLNSQGCDSTATLNLTVRTKTTSTTNVTICTRALPYSWNGSRAAAGTYTFSTTNSQGCDSTATLNLTVRTNTTSTTNVSICPSALPYSWNGSRAAAGTYTFTTTNSQGCDSTATLNLTVKTNTTSTTNVSICPSALPYLWNGVNRNSAGTYTFTTTNSQGCDSVATLNLTVKTNTTSTTNVSICPSVLPYLWNGVNRNSAGTYTFTTINSQGCDSTATLNLTVKTNTTSTNNVSICPSALPYSWNGSRAAAGTYTFSTTNSQGCDSVATLNLAVRTNTTSTTNVSICPSALPYSWNGSRAAAGTYTFSTTNSQGCDSVATLNLTVKTNTTSTNNVSICPSALPYSWNGSRVAAGTYTFTTTNSQGCDSVATLNLTVKTNTTSTTNVSICPSALPYLWNGVNRNSAGTYTFTTINSQGCDSILTLNLNVKQASSSNLNVSVCDTLLPFVWNSTNYNAAGTYTINLINAVGCDSTATLNLTVLTCVPPCICNLTASIGVNQISQCVIGNAFAFTANVLGSKGTLSYFWDFNDGTSSTLANPTHTYATAGEHDVTLIVTDISTGNCVCVAYASTVQIHVGAKPSGSFKIIDNGNCNKTLISTSTITGGWMNYSWDLGNGTTSTLVNPTTYYPTGTYTATLIATGNFGCSDTVTQTIIVANCSATPAPTPTPNCNAGFAAPCLITSYICADTTSHTYNLNLVTLTCSKPDSTVLEWHSDNPATPANIISNVTAVGIGNYWAVYRDTVNNCYGNGGFATQNVRVDTCSNSVTAGGTGGVESKTLGDVIAVRLYGNAINSTTQVDGLTKGIKFTQSGAIVNGANDLTLNALMPTTVSNTDAVYVSTPTDLVNFTNAVEVLSLDYTKAGSTKAVAFATKTLGDVYSHTKPICDRLKGAELLEVKNITVKGFNLMAYKVRQRTGEVEYAINLSAGTQTNRSSISLQSNWFTDSYQTDEKLYNFQLWAVSYEMAKAMATDIVTKLQANGTVNNVTNADLPKAYISKGSRKNTALNVTIQNNTANTSGYFELQEKANENSQVTTRQVPFTVNANGVSNVTIPVKDNYEGNIYVYLNNKLTDLVYLSDGTWALDYNKNTTSISKFDIANESNPTTNSDEHRLFRNVSVTGTSKDYITVYKTMMGGGLEQNVANFKSLLFTANATGAASVTVTLVKKSITDWKNQYTYTMPLDGAKEYGINLNQFTSKANASAINANDIVAVNFSFLNSRGTPASMNISLSKARFASSTIATDVTVNKMGVYPNPTTGKFTVNFSSEAAQPLVLKVIEVSTGRTVKTQFINATKGANQAAVELSNTTSTNGLFIVTLEGDSTKYNAAKLMVNRK